MSPPPRVVTSTFLSYPADSSRQRASLVVIPIDDFRNDRPAAGLRVVLLEQPRRRAVTNNSGHAVFLDLPAGTYTLVVEPDPVHADWYFLRPTGTEPWRTSFERPVTLPKGDPLEPVERVTLTPKPGYPFPAGTTLLVGRVTERAGAGGPAPLASVVTSYDRLQKDNPDLLETVVLETATDVHGYFVLSFHSLPDTAQAITVTARSGSSSGSATVTIHEGETTTAAVDLR